MADDAGMVRAIVNPVSGRRSLLPIVRRIATLLEPHGVSMTIELTRGPGHATKLAGTISADARALLIAGGDGTVSEVINGLSATAVPFVVLGSGTENLLARELKFPTTAIEIAQTLLTGEVRPLDRGLVNGRHFVAISGVGFDAECVARMSDARRGHITRASYFCPLWRTFWSHRFPRFSVEVEGKICFEGPGLALVGMISRYASQLRMFPRARCDDGLLDVVVFPCRSRTRLSLHAVRVLLARHLKDEEVIYEQGRVVRVSSLDGGLLEVDGEAAGALPATWEVQRGALRYLSLQAVKCNSGASVDRLRPELA